MAAVIREAIDSYLTEPATDLDQVLEATLGTLPNLDVPSRAEWGRRDRRHG